jgi:hypothetical protein
LIESQAIWLGIFFVLKKPYLGLLILKLNTFF